MKYLILGASGFIGRHLTKKLLALGNEVTAFDMRHDDEFQNLNLVKIEGQFSPEYDFASLVKGHDIVFHLISTTFPTSVAPLTEEITENIFSTLSLLDACVTEQVKRVIFISSGGTVYGTNLAEPVSEESPTNPISSYGIQKLMIEKYLHLYHHKFGLDYRVVRLSNPYGPGQNPKGAVGAVTVFLNRAMNGESITVFGDGNSVRDYIYIDDAVSGLLNIAHSNFPHKVYNLGSGKGISLNDILEEVVTLLGKKPDLTFLPKRDSDVTYSVLNTERYSSAFPTHEFVDLKKGMNWLYQSFIEEENSGGDYEK